MTENPYQSPMSDLQPATGVLSGRPEDVRAVAVYQKGILVCILIYFLAIISQFAIPIPFRIVPTIGIGLVGLVGVVFVFLLAMKIYGVAVGVLLGLLTFFPCLGLLVLLIVNSKATSVLKQNGHRVGLLGANLSEF